MVDNKDYVWHVNSPKPKFLVKRIDFSIVQLFQADGDELELIRARFQNVPICYSICTWRGQLAQFIYDNL